MERESIEGLSAFPRRVNLHKRDNGEDEEDDFDAAIDHFRNNGVHLHR